jgi:hypothetical protein
MSTSRYDHDDPLNRVQSVYRRYSSSSGSKEYDNAGPATDAVGEIIEMVRDSVTADSLFGEKHQAMSSILKISNKIVEGNRSTLGSEIRNGFWFPEIGSAVNHIFDMLSPEELGALQADGELTKELRSARGHAQAYALDVELDDVISKVAMEDYMSEDEDEGEVHGSSSQQPIDLTHD